MSLFFTHANAIGLHFFIYFLSVDFYVGSNIAAAELGWPVVGVELRKEKGGLKPSGI